MRHHHILFCSASPASKGENLFFPPPTHNITSASPMQTRRCCLVSAAATLSVPWRGFGSLSRLCLAGVQLQARTVMPKKGDRARVLIGTRRASLGPDISYDVKCAAVDS